MTMVAKPNNAMTMQKNKDKITIEDGLRERERERERERVECSFEARVVFFRFLILGC
jgi:hypothetical protein